MDIEAQFINELNKLLKLNDEGSIKKKANNKVAFGKMINKDLTIIFNLIYSYKYPTDSTSFDLLMLDEDIRENKEYFHFGKNLTHGLNYVIDKKNGKIITLYDTDEIAFYSAQDSVSFIASMVEAIKLEVLYEEDKVDNKVLSLYQKKCITLAGGAFYKEYYELIIPIL